jgi:hypothetical protein
MLEDVGRPTLAGLRVDADDGLVTAADVLRVDRQVRHTPGEVFERYPGIGRIAFQCLEAFLDRILV